MDICMTTSGEMEDSDSRIISPEDNIDLGKSDNCVTVTDEMEDSDSQSILLENNIDQKKSDSCMMIICEMEDSNSHIISPEDNIDQGKSDNCISTKNELMDSDVCIISPEDNIDQGKSDNCISTKNELMDSDVCIISPEDNIDQGKSDNCISTKNELMDSDVCIISPEDNTDQDSKNNTYIDIHSIWQCMKRINSNLDFLSQKFNALKSDKVRVQAQKLPSSSSLDDFDFLLLFPLKKIEDVMELESRLKDDGSHFYKKLISFITPKDNKHVLDLKNFIRTILRTLFTYSLTSNYSWRGFRGNFQIGNLKIIKIIFDISKMKYKNVTKQCVNSFIKEWIRYAKQRHKQLKTN